ncbi:hypothetical protein [Dyadobacter sp. CY347]|uniref:hypothetical protein n=1 Tax=Dyadobacter sp. CY347 TaxID=2909336 RepID=UPI001F258B13|nr:hypothetical protein [Dyadobacter sp. CY347]MCF2491120.1 hypothetical protein [Dyadobacter sp. CY347]
MKYEEHLLNNVHGEDEKRLDDAWQQPFDDNYDGAVSWKKLITPALPTQKPLDLASIYKPESLTSIVKQVSFGHFRSYFIWKH